jgi:hypothetical protein
MPNLFAQLGLPSDPAAIDGFVESHSPLAPGLALSEAPFWTPSQAAFLREETLGDADWAEVIDALNRELASHGRSG